MTETIYGGDTAIYRKHPPAPLNWLRAKGLLRGRTLDYGSGHHCWFGMTCYDPKWRPVRLSGKFDTIACLSVLNVVPPAVQKDVIRKVRGLLAPGGVAYFAVRRDLPRSGKMGRGTWQHYVVLRMPSIRKVTGYEIYMMRR